jgi:hypothetical protein
MGIGCVTDTILRALIRINLKLNIVELQKNGFA